jgi:hypothetical protein
LFSNVINNERLGKYVGATVQTIPHVSDEIKKIILKQAETGADIVIVQVGGSLLDYESLIYLNAIREVINDEGRENTFVINVDFLQYLQAIRYYKHARVDNMLSCEKKAIKAQQLQSLQQELVNKLKNVGLDLQKRGYNTQDYAKLIKMQANQTAPYEKAVDIKKTPKGKSNSKGYKVKTLGKRR